MAEEKHFELKTPEISRRNFLVGTGAVLGSLAAGSLFSFNMTKAQAATTLPLPFPVGGFTAADLEKIRQRAFEGYVSTNCCYGGAKGLLDTLKEKLSGTGWDYIPLDMFKWGGGGGLAWGTICGALNGTLPIVNLLAPDKINNFANYLLSWYGETSFPSTNLDTWIAGNALYNTKYNLPNQTTSISSSPLCHNSVSIWSKASGAKISSDAKKARCGKLTGDVAVKVAELLNDYFLNNVLPSSPVFDADTTSCLGCHNGVNTRDDDQGKMTCGECHSDGGKNIAPKCTKPISLP